MKSIVFVYEEGEVFIISLSFLQSDDFDFFWRKITQDGVSVETVLSSGGFGYKNDLSFRSNSGFFSVS